MRLSTLIFLVLLLSSCVDNVETGSKAPELKGTDIHGRAFDVAQLKGEYVVVDFWGSWCGPCLREAPNTVKLYKDYKDVVFSGGEGFQMVSVALERGEDRWRAVSEKFGFDWPHQLVDISSYVRTSDYATAYGVTDIPAMFLLSPTGEVLVNKGSAEDVRAYLETIATP